MKKAVVFLADDFEEVEGLTVVDILRRAGIRVTTVSVSGGKIVRGSHGIKLYADDVIENPDYSQFDAVILPGGMPGTMRLMKNELVGSVVKQFDREGKLVAAICAAPGVLGRAGILTGRKATVYPGFEEHLVHAEYIKNEVVKDGHIITAPGAGRAFEFAFAVLGYLTDEETVEKLKAEIIF